MSDLLVYFQARTDAMVNLLTEMVNHESFSRDKPAVDRFAAFIEAQCIDTGATVTRYPQSEVGNCLLAKWNADAPGQPILLLGHMDTVFPAGALAERPVRIDDDGRLYGPGAVDMKAGLTIGLTAIRALIDRNALPNRPVWFFFNTDEEIGSNASTPIIRELAATCALVLVLEPATRDGAIKSSRKGVATYRVYVEGRASHAGNAPEEGVNAIVEMAQQIMVLNALNDLRHGTSVSVTKIEGGTAGNVIPAAASIHVDTRVVAMLEMDRIRAAIDALQPHIPGASVRVESIHTRPPMEYNATMRASVERCQTIGQRHGITVRHDSVGGGSDGNTTAAMGIPTLDGLGAVGDGLHATHEHVLISSLPQRAALLAALLTDWPAG